MLCAQRYGPGAGAAAAAFAEPARFAVQLVTLRVVGRFLPDPLEVPWEIVQVPEANVRELMVSLWYSAASTSERWAPYMTRAESELLLRDAGIMAVPTWLGPGVTGQIRVNVAMGRGRC